MITSLRLTPSLLHPHPDPPPSQGGGVACVPILLCGPPFADCFEHELLGVLDERFPQVSRRLEPVDGARQEHTAGALPIALRLIHPRGDFALIPQRLGCPNQPQAGADDHGVARAEVFLRAVIDRPHTLGGRRVLEDNARQASVVCASLHFLAIEQVVITGVSLWSRAAIPIGRVRQHLGDAEAGALAAAAARLYVLPLAAFGGNGDTTSRRSSNAEKHGVL